MAKVVFPFGSPYYSDSVKFYLSGKRAYFYWLVKKGKMSETNIQNRQLKRYHLQ